ncbi:hypothetical protein YOLOSWAG_7 [Erwinia phage vB_EamM_Yoloswag]|uniref:Uncharacterized protein n=1 Tax=Erwinia phage vB_EamM_Yoloswag TaxID=1958956 RepID=A0A1S6L2T3_9CAUD|nr:hypothetical protein HOR66_gp007 [Erwinia phage vB_EamM_Yoloswag]AQT28494.1 hypothetical protein YOLOSWAG_7 [Erwinia phage vB_EamM_Yoloswag]
MYRFPTCTVEGQATALVYIHPQYKNYGVAFKVDRSDKQTDVLCDIVYGDIDGKTKLTPQQDFSAPLDVTIWALNAMRIIQQSVNSESINIEDLFANHGGVIVYTTNQE